MTQAFAKESDRNRILLRCAHIMKQNAAMVAERQISNTQIGKRSKV